jgi:hypothetical protein
MSTLEAFFADLERDPQDWPLRGVLADWYEDNGRPELAECLRWMIRKRKRPHHRVKGTYVWFNADANQDLSGDDPESDLPGAVYKRVAGGLEQGGHKSFPSLRAAEESFQAAWLAARRQGWKAGD